MKKIFVKCHQDINVSAYFMNCINFSIDFTAFLFLTPRSPAMSIARIDGRACDELRPISFVMDYLSHPLASLLISCGKTRVLTAATFEDKVPQWMKNQKVPGGWITCEYGMLPSATGERFKREAAAGKQGGRTVEIQRLIGRSLRMAADLNNTTFNTKQYKKWEEDNAKKAQKLL